MAKQKIVTHGGISINIAQVKSFRLESKGINSKSHSLVVEFKTRMEYILNPKTKEYEKQEFHDQTEIEFKDYEMASNYLLEWEDIWQDYLNENES